VVKAPLPGVASFAVPMTPFATAAAPSLRFETLVETASEPVLLLDAVENELADVVPPPAGDKEALPPPAILRFSSRRSVRSSSLDRR
jgi:hypothetical protein